MAKTKKAPKFVACTLKFLSESKLVEAADRAVSLNPANSPWPAIDRAFAFGVFTDKPPKPQELAVLTTKYWGAGGVKLSVGFLDTNSAELQNKILDYMNYWHTKGLANVQFSRTANASDAQVRIARQRGDGYWSYLGTDVLSIGRGQATMNLDNFTHSTPEAEYRRVVVHETGHTLGFPHEHLRASIIAKLDRQKTIDYFRRQYGWSQSVTVANVLTPLSESSIMGSPETDETSIMTYQLPGDITKDGRPIVGGGDLSRVDIDFCQKLYPNPNPPPPPPPTGDKKRLILEITGDVQSVRVVALE